MRRLIVGISLFAMAFSASAAENSPEKLTFDVVSVKVAAPQPDGQIMRRLMGGPGSPDPGTLTYENVTVKLLTTIAYNVKDFQVEGPDWINSAGFDIIAKMPQGTTDEQMRLMMQGMLAERFKVTLHRDTRQIPAYVLVVGKSGSKMKASATPAPATDTPGMPQARPGGVRMMMGMNGVHMVGSMSMGQLATQLGRAMDRPVLDQTELTGNFDVDITWMPDEMSQVGPRGIPPPPPPVGSSGHGGPDSPSTAHDPVFTLPQALQEILGLKLETRKTSAEIIVIDHAEKTPVEN